MKILSDLAHVAWGFFAVLYEPYLCTAVFIFKQYMDWKSGKEQWSETVNDIVEFCVGLVAGYIVRAILML